MEKFHGTTRLLGVNFGASVGFINARFLLAVASIHTSEQKVYLARML